MATKKNRTPYTPSQRFYEPNVQEIEKSNNPEPRLTKSNHRKKGRNCYGRITSRRRGGGHKRLYREIDFKRNKFNIPAKIESIEYDPNRTANVALLVYVDGEKRYILAPNGLKVGDSVIDCTAPVEEYNDGMSMPLRFIPPATAIHALEMQPGRGAQIARSAGNAAQLISVEGDRATVKMPSGEVRIDRKSVV